MIHPIGCKGVGPLVEMDLRTDVTADIRFALTAALWLLPPLLWVQSTKIDCTHRILFSHGVVGGPNDVSSPQERTAGAGLPLRRRRRLLPRVPPAGE